MIVAQRQSALAKRTVSDNDQFARPPLLILIDAPFPSRLARYTRGRQNAKAEPAWFSGMVRDDGDRAIAA
jgi:hypothetical protein